MRVPIVITLVALSVAVGSTPAAAADWNQCDHDAGHTRGQPSDPHLDRSTILDVERAWRTDITPLAMEGVTAAPSIVDGVVYAAAYGVWNQADGTARSRVSALDLTSGSVLWTRRVPGVVRWPVAVDGGLAIVAVHAPDVPYRLVALDRVTGEPRWRTRVGCPDCRSGRGEDWAPSLSGGTVTVAIGGGWVGGWNPYGRLVAVDAATGAVTWWRHVPYPSDPVIVDGAVVVGRANSRMNGRETILAYEVADGSLRWRRREGMGWYTALSASRDRVYAMTGRRLLALSSEDGTIAWAQPLRPGDRPTVGTRSLFRSDPLQAFRRSDGSPTWSVDASQLGWTTLRAPILVNGVLIVHGWYEYGDRVPAATRVSPPGAVAVGAATGRVLGRIPVGRAGLAPESTAIADGYLVTARGGAIVAYT